MEIDFIVTPILQMKKQKLWVEELAKDKPWEAKKVNSKASGFDSVTTMLHQIFLGIQPSSTGSRKSQEAGAAFLVLSWAPVALTPRDINWACLAGCFCFLRKPASAQSFRLCPP